MIKPMHVCGTALTASSATAIAPLTGTAEQDHQNTMRQLGINALRRGPSGNARPGEPNAANYDEARAIAWADRFINRKAPVQTAAN